MAEEQLVSTNCGDCGQVMQVPLSFFERDREATHHRFEQPCPAVRVPSSSSS